MGLFDLFRSRRKGCYVPALLGEYDQLIAEGESHESAGLAIFSEHLGLGADTEECSIYKGDLHPRMLRFMVNAFHDPAWLCNFVDLCLRHKLEVNIRSTLPIDQKYFEQLGSLYFVGNLLDSLANHYLKMRLQGGRITEDQAKDAIEAAFWATVLAPSSPAGWTTLAICDTLGVRFSGDERDHVARGLQACDESVNLFAGLNMPEQLELTETMRESLRQMAKEQA